MEGGRLGRTMLQGFCSLELTFIISSAGIFFSTSDEIMLKVKKGLQIITVCECVTSVIKVGKDFTGPFWRGTQNLKGCLGTLRPAALLLEQLPHSILFINFLSSF